MSAWYNKRVRVSFRDIIRSTLMRLLEVPSQNEFDEKAQKRIDEWLLQTAQHPGFHFYLKARDRAVVQTMLGLDIEVPQQKRAYYELAGRRIELVRLMQRGQKLLKQADDERRAREAQKTMRERKAKTLVSPHSSHERGNSAQETFQ